MYKNVEILGFSPLPFFYFFPLVWGSSAHEARPSIPCHLIFLKFLLFSVSKPDFTQSPFQKRLQNEAAFHFMEESIALGNRFVFNDS